MSKYQLILSARIEEMFKDLFEMNISEGSFNNFFDKEPLLHIILT